MAHEIGEHDGLVLHKEAAWHGLGTVVQDAPTPKEALQIAGLDWEVVQYPLVAVKRGLAADGSETRTPLLIPERVANYRSDTDTMLGLVGGDYTPIQNAELADFCECLAEQGDVVKVESAGSIRNGQKVWFLLKGESFAVRREEDQVVPYYCISNGHDGGTALRCTPTTVRVVCSNTLHMVIPQKETKRTTKQALKQGIFVAHHTKSIKERVEEAKQALGLYGRALEKTREAMDYLGAKDVGTADRAHDFFIKCYAHDFGDIPLNPVGKKELDKAWQAKEAFLAVKQRFEREEPIAGPTMWNLFNAYTGWLQNERLPNINDPQRAHDSKLQSKLFGEDAERALRALNNALMIAG